MPTLTRPDGEIHYETYGTGFPVLLFAPGGLRSRLAMWSAPLDGPPRPWVDWTLALPKAGFMAVAMDQRNAGQSRTASEADHGWHTYAADHLALMDHLNCPRFHVLGGCIGGTLLAQASTSRRRPTHHHHTASSGRGIVLLKNPSGSGTRITPRTVYSRSGMPRMWLPGRHARASLGRARFEKGALGEKRLRGRRNMWSGGRAATTS
jgi:pimeloyl-ACP methyl ester carboxylesterase